MRAMTMEMTIDMIEAVKIINFAIMGLFFICYFYQFVYVAVSLLCRTKPRRTEARPHARSQDAAACAVSEKKIHRIAVLIAARNEEAVIGELLDSIRAQSYPAEYVDVYVGADNCTDGTAATARAHGAEVFERYDAEKVGKGYVLNYLLRKIAQTAPEPYDAYLVLDADNVLDPHFIREIDRTFSDGYEVVTCYRNSKNYGDNWISAGYALWFLREARYLSAARMALRASCAVSGTGFLFSDSVLKSCGGWKYYLLTEDIEFTIDNIVRGRKIGYAERAVCYDEQPVSFQQSWRQRLRWAKGNFQVFKKYRRQLLGGIFRGSFSCYDMTMNIMPAAILTAVSAAVNLCAAFCVCLLAGGLTGALIVSFFKTLFGMYMTFFAMGAVTTATEWDNIYCPSWKKILYAFTFPLFMLTYMPICIVALFAKVDWKPVRHCRNLTLKQIKEMDRLSNRTTAG